MVASKIFGIPIRWVERDHGTSSDVIVEPRSDHPDSGLNVKEYSTDIAAAWEVLEKVRHHLVAISTTMNPESLEWVVDLCMNRDAEERHKSLPMAICIAALRAVGVDETTIQESLK